VVDKPSTSPTTNHDFQIHHVVLSMTGDDQKQPSTTIHDVHCHDVVFNDVVILEKYIVFGGDKVVTTEHYHKQAITTFNDNDVVEHEIRVVSSGQQLLEKSPK